VTAHPNALKRPISFLKMITEMTIEKITLILPMTVKVSAEVALMAKKVLTFNANAIRPLSSSINTILVPAKVVAHREVRVEYSKVNMKGRVINAEGGAI
jgi:hypothetical protein